MDCSKTESHLHILRSLLHYHERMMMDKSCSASYGEHKCENEEKLVGKCPNLLLRDMYSEALKEGIRCIEIVHKDELTNNFETGSELI